MKKFLCIAANPVTETFKAKFVSVKSNSNADLITEETNDELLKALGYSGCIWGVIKEDNLVEGLVDFYRFYKQKQNQ